MCDEKETAFWRKNQCYVCLIDNQYIIVGLMSLIINWRTFGLVHATKTLGECFQAAPETWSWPRRGRVLRWEVGEHNLLAVVAATPVHPARGRKDLALLAQVLLELLDLLIGPDIENDQEDEGYDNLNNIIR